MMGLAALSLSRLQTCDERIQKVMLLAATRANFIVTCGHRNQVDQLAAFKSGASKKLFPMSRHNSYPSEAVDISPLPIDWSNIEAYKALAVIVKECAQELGVTLEHGGDWPHLQDWPHWQLPKQPVKPTP